MLETKERLDRLGIDDQDFALRQVTGQAFHNDSKLTMRDLRARASRQRLRADFEACLDGFSPHMQDILDNFEFRNQIPRLLRGDTLTVLIEKLTSPEVNLSPEPVRGSDGSARLPGLDNRGMGSVVEELVGSFNEEAGEHFTQCDAVMVMAKLAFLPVVDRIGSGTYLNAVAGAAPGRAGISRNCLLERKQ